MKKVVLFLLFISVLSCKEEKPKGWIDRERLNNRAAEDWLTLGGNEQMQHYSPLNNINASNVQDLGFAWEYDATTIIGNVPRVGFINRTWMHRMHEELAAMPLIAGWQFGREKFM